MLSNILLDDDRRIEREASLHEVVEQAGQDDLRDIDQEVDISGEPWTAANQASQAADERVSMAQRKPDGVSSTTHFLKSLGYGMATGLCKNEGGEPWAMNEQATTSPVIVDIMRFPR